MVDYILHLFCHVWEYSATAAYRCCRVCGKKEIKYNDWWMEVK